MGIHNIVASSLTIPQLDRQAIGGLAKIAIGMAKKLDLIGRQFGRLKVAAEGGRIGKKKERAWLCQCACGGSKVVRTDHLTGDRVRSCGCLRADVAVVTNTIHGYARQDRVSPEFISWASMIQRCTNKSSPQYARYGGRGIEVCFEWENSFEAFLRDMGPRPSLKHSLDRFPDNNGNYEPGNVRWANSKEQTRNYSRNVIVTLNGMQMCLVDAVDKLGLPYWKVNQRMRRGWSFEKAINTP